VNETLEPRLAADRRLWHVADGGRPHPLDVKRLGERREGHLADSLVVDHDGELLYCGPALARLIGTTTTALTGRRIQQLLPGLTPDHLLVQCGLAQGRPALTLGTTPNSATRILEITRRAWGLARPVARAHRIAREDGTTLPIDLTYGTLAVRGGHWLMVLGVRPRRHAAQALLQQLVDEVEHFPALALITDVGGRIEYVNPPLESRFGYSAFELTGQPVETLQACDATGSPAFRTVRPWLGEVVFRDRRGRAFSEEIRIRPWAIDGGPITHLACFGRDAAER
jgi:PAS domain S-box-containing protein